MGTVINVSALFKSDNGWRDVNQDRPPENEDILVYNKHCDQMFVAWFGGVKKSWTDGAGRVYFTHWRHLPNAPMERRKIPKGAYFT